MEWSQLVNRISIPTDQRECWQWTGGRAGIGVHEYGRVTIDGHSRGVHRVVYEFLKAPVPNDKVIDHLCRNHLCVNPDHMEVVTSKENTLRGTNPCAQKARQTHCHRGHPFSGYNLRIITKDGRKTRVCVTCYNFHYQ